MTDTCDVCGAESDRLSIGSQGGGICDDCYGSGPVCDDCDMYIQSCGSTPESESPTDERIEDGPYHLCRSCAAAREARHGV